MRARWMTLLFTALLAMGCKGAGAEIAKAAISTGAAILAAAAYHAASGECWASCTHGYTCDRRRGVCVPAVDRSGSPIVMTQVGPQAFCIEEDDGTILCPDDPQTNYGTDGTASPAATAGAAPRPRPPRHTGGACQGLCYAQERCRVIDGMAYCVTEDDPLYEDDEEAGETDSDSDDDD